MTHSGYDIERLIPQRDPFMMVDTFEECDDHSGAATLAVRQGNYFMLPDHTLAETGLIEHIAQSCSALAGSLALADTSRQEQGLADKPPVGIIGAVKHFTCHRRPQRGETVRTTVTFDMTFGNVTIATGQSFVGEELIAEANLKIFIQ